MNLVPPFHGTILPSIGERDDSLGPLRLASQTARKRAVVSRSGHPGSAACQRVGLPPTHSIMSAPWAQGVTAPFRSAHLETIVRREALVNGLTGFFENVWMGFGEGATSRDEISTEWEHEPVGVALDHPFGGHYLLVLIPVHLNCLGLGVKGAAEQCPREHTGCR